MNNISVTPKGGTIASQLSGSDVNLSTPSVVKLNLNRSDIKSFARNGNDLVVTTKSGETVVIHNFYGPAGESDLVLQDDKGALWWVENPGEQGFQYVSIDSTEGLLADNLTSDNTIAAFGIGGAALAGIGALFGVLVIADAVRKVILQEVPQADWMGTVGLVALLANTYCFYLLYSHRADDLNMRS
uniref:BapA/Bap/LapF family prefix-like domain-containing protein n=1 Tax=Pantoea septica TaxID=472695 RepID=UPI00289E3379